MIESINQTREIVEKITDDLESFGITPLEESLDWRIIDDSFNFIVSIDLEKVLCYPGLSLEPKSFDLIQKYSKNHKKNFQVETRPMNIKKNDYKPDLVAVDFYYEELQGDLDFELMIQLMDNCGYSEKLAEVELKKVFSRQEATKTLEEAVGLFYSELLTEMDKLKLFLEKQIATVLSFYIDEIENL